MDINEFTEPELAYYREFCNFNEKEAALFELRGKKIPLEECAEMLDFEDVKKTSVKVNKKIEKMIKMNRMEEWIENVYWKRIMQNQ